MSTFATVVAGISLAVAGAVAGALGTSDRSGVPDAVDEHVMRHTPLRTLAAAHGVDVGVAIGPESIDSGDERTLVTHDFGMVTIENALKWDAVHRSPGEFSFDDADDLVAFADDHGLAVRGHALVWHEQNPAWFENARWGRDQALDLLDLHITTVVERYAGRVDHWDVVNEPLRDDGPGLRDTIWRTAIGEDYIARAFEIAHAADPDAVLFLNDYDGGDGSKYGRLVDLAIELRSDGVPVHGVGFQLHLAGELDADAVAEQVDRASRAGLDVAFTEIDDRLPDDGGHRSRVEQGRRLAALAEVCIDAPACRSFVVWGLSDGHSWIPDHFPGLGSGTLMDDDLVAKPSYVEVSRVFAAPASSDRERT